jgi:hypothetical protein
LVDEGSRVLDIEIEDTTTGKRVIMEVEPDTRISEVIDELLAQYGQPSEEETYALTLGGKQLHPDRALKDYNIREGDRLVAVPMRITGG